MGTPKDQFSSAAYVRKTNDQDVERKISAQHEYRHAAPVRRGTGTVLRIIDLAPGALAARLGLQVGDEVLEVNGHPLLDVIDFQFRIAGFDQAMSLRTRRGTIEFVRKEWDDFGAEFEPISPLVCDNDCVFCFVHQNPPDTRRSLRIKDEDYRLSFLFGNYLTLTNVDEQEIKRIIDQQLSPLYISVHATAPELRTRLLGNDRYDGLEAKLDRLAEGGIRMHCQIVLCPGLNDGRHLERTVSDLSDRYPAVSSVAVVPVGLTDHRENLPKLDPVTPEYAADAIRQVETFQRSFAEKWGTPFVFLGDEFYILAGESIPLGNHYDGFPQIENGVGMVRTFLDQFEEAVTGFVKPTNPVRGTICTGKLFQPYLQACVNRLGMDLKTVAVQNRFWGAGINVAGLLTGSDFVSQLNGAVYGEFVILPSESMIGEDGLFLDDMRIVDVEERLGLPIHASGYDAVEFLGVVQGLGR